MSVAATMLFCIFARFMYADSWRIRLGCHSRGFSYIDYDNRFGISPTASDQHGTEDAINMVSPETHYIDIYFPHDDPMRPGYWSPPYNCRYSIDIRSDGTNQHLFYFDLRVQIPSAESIAIYWVELDAVPPQYCVEISPLHGAVTNIFKQDTIWDYFVPGVYYYLATVKKNAFQKLSIRPEVLFLRLGEAAHISPYLIGPADTAYVNATIAASGGVVTIAGATATGVVEGMGYIRACFRGWCDTIPVVVAGTGIASSIHLNPGWNMISLPVMPATPCASSIFGGLYPNIYRFNSDAEAYERLDTIEPGEGFFILSICDTTLNLIGNPVMHIDKSVNPGWHLIGSAMMPVAAHAVDASPAGSIVPTFWGFSRQSYFISDTLMPGIGYWVLALRNSIISISP